MKDLKLFLFLFTFLPGHKWDGEMDYQSPA